MKTTITFALACASVFPTMAPAYGQFGRMMGGHEASAATATPTMMPTVPTPAPEVQASTGPKKSRVVRIAIVAPQSNMGGPGQNDAGEGLRAECQQLLAGPTLEAVPLTASLTKLRADSAAYANAIANEEIRARAHQLWIERGCPMGSPDEDWFRAKQELRKGTFALLQR